MFHPAEQEGTEKQAMESVSEPPYSSSSSSSLSSSKPPPASSIRVGDTFQAVLPPFEGSLEPDSNHIDSTDVTFVDKDLVESQSSPACIFSAEEQARFAVAVVEMKKDLHAVGQAMQRSTADCVLYYYSQFKKRHIGAYKKLKLVLAVDCCGAKTGAEQCTKCGIDSSTSIECDICSLSFCLECGCIRNPEDIPELGEWACPDCESESLKGGNNESEKHKAPEQSTPSQRRQNPRRRQRSTWIGKTVTKYFKGFGWFRGTIKSLDRSPDGRPLYHIAYEDGDEEDLEAWEVRELTVLEESTNSASGDASKAPPVNEKDEVLKSCQSIVETGLLRATETMRKVTTVAVTASVTTKEDPPVVPMNSTSPLDEIGLNRIDAAILPSLGNEANCSIFYSAKKELLRAPEACSNLDIASLPLEKRHKASPPVACSARG